MFKPQRLFWSMHHFFVPLLVSSLSISCWTSAKETTAFPQERSQQLAKRTPCSTFDEDIHRANDLRKASLLTDALDSLPSFQYIPSECPAQVYDAHSTRGRILEDAGEYLAAINSYHEALLLPESKRNYFQISSRLVSVLCQVGMFAEADEVIKSILDAPILHDVDSGWKHLAIGTISAYRSDSAEALKRLLTAREIAKIVGDSELRLEIELFTSWVHASNEDLEGAQQSLDTAFSLAQTIYSGNHPVLIAISIIQANILLKARDYSTARKYYRSARANLEKLNRPSHPQMYSLAISTALIDFREGKNEEARASLGRLLDSIDDNYQLGILDRANAVNLFAIVARNSQQESLAMERLSVLCNLLLTKLPYLAETTATSLINLGNLYIVRKQYQEAESALEKAGNVASEYLGKCSPKSISASNSTINSLQEQKKYLEAIEFVSRDDCVNGQIDTISYEMYIYLESIGVVFCKETRYSTGREFLGKALELGNEVRVTESRLDKTREWFNACASPK